MANNRLYIVDKYEKSYCMIAKFFLSKGWCLGNVDTLKTFLTSRCTEHLRLETEMGKNKIFRKKSKYKNYAKDGRWEYE